MRSTKSALLAIAAVASLLAGCASEDGGPGARSEASSRRAASGPLAFQSFSAQTQTFMKDGLHQFSAKDPQWETTRETWLAMGPEEADFLVQLLWGGLLAAQAGNEPKLVEQARYELAKIGEPAVPMLAECLVGGTVFALPDPETGGSRNVQVDDLARREASEILGLVGAPAVGAVRGALERSASKAGRRYAIETLGYIGDRGGEAAYQPLLAWARSEDDVLRVAAVRALRSFSDETTRSALIQALGDADDLVRRKAAESLMARRDTSAVAYIRAAADRAREGAKLSEAAELDRAASWIEKHPK